jgi:hypothetical protein
VSQRAQRHRTAAAPAPAQPASGWGALGRRFRRLTLAGFIVAAPFTLLTAQPALGLLALAALAALTFAAGRWARRQGLPEARVTAPLTALAFALVVAVRALAGGTAGSAGTTIPGLLVFLQAVLAMWDVAAAAPLTPGPTVGRLAAAVARGPVPRLLVTAGLGLLVVRGVTVALAAPLDGAFAWAAVAALAAALLWLRPAPQGTLLAALVFAAAPGGLVLGVATDQGLWAPLSRPLAACVGLTGARPGVLLTAVAAASLLALATTLLAAAGAADAAADEAPRAAEAPPR